MTVGPVDVVDGTSKAGRRLERLAAEPERLNAVGVISALAIVDIAFQRIAAAPQAHLDVGDGVDRAMTLPCGSSNHSGAIGPTTISSQYDSVGIGRGHEFVVDSLSVPIISDIDLHHSRYRPRSCGDFVN